MYHWYQIAFDSQMKWRIAFMVSNVYISPITKQSHNTIKSISQNLRQKSNDCIGNKNITTVIILVHLLFNITIT